MYFFFFFQAEDGIRDFHVTGVQTCALPILFSAVPRWRVIRLAFGGPKKDAPWEERLAAEIRSISIINGPNFLPSADALRTRVEGLRNRSDYPQGMMRQFDAILGTGSLLRYTRRIVAPTVVIHGTE